MPARGRAQRAFAPCDGTDRSAVRGDPAGAPAGHRLPPAGLGPLLDHGTGMAAGEAPPRGDARPPSGGQRRGPENTAVRALPAGSAAPGAAPPSPLPRDIARNIARVRRKPDRARYDTAAAHAVLDSPPVLP